MSVGKPGKRLRRDVGRLELALAAHADAVAVGADLGARRAQLGDHGVEVLGQAVAHEHVAARDRGRDQQRPRLDAIGDDGVLDRVQLVDALDRDERRARAADPRAHLVEHARQLLDLRLARGVLQRRAPARQRRRHHEVLGAGHGDHVEDDRRAAQPPRARVDVAVLELDARAHRRQALEVLVDRARADRAAARQRHARAAVARHQRPQHQHRGAHGLHQVVGRLVLGDSAWCRRPCDPLALEPRRRGAPAGAPWSGRRRARGRCGRSTGPRASSDDARIGSAAFFDAGDAHLAPRGARRRG